MGWNPDSYTDAPASSGDSGGDYDEREVPSGDYVMGITWQKSVSARSQKLRMEVLAGPMKGASCFPLVSKNVEEKKGSADRMFHICKSFHISGDLDFSDACFASKFVGRAGKVKIQKKQNGNFTNHDIRRAFHRAECSETERTIMVEWQEAYGSRASSGGGGGDWPGGYDAPFPDPDEFGGGGFGDDDIPF